MSGVRTGTRLQQMLELRSRLDHEIAAERRRLALAARPRRGEGPNRVDVMLAELGVTARDVKVWAVTTSRIEHAKGGRIGADLVEQYAIAHNRREVTL